MVAAWRECHVSRVCMQLWFGRLEEDPPMFGAFVHTAPWSPAHPHGGPVEDAVARFAAGDTAARVLFYGVVPCP